MSVANHAVNHGSLDKCVHVEPIKQLTGGI